MPVATLPARTDASPAGFVQALLSGGDSRITADARTGLSKYLCPAMPAPGLISAASCTASPPSVRGFAEAAEAFSHIIQAPSPRQQAARLAALTNRIETRLLEYFGASALARVLLCPSGTDALLTTAMLIAAEQPGEPLTSILPAAAETGTGVPLAAQCRRFDGAASGTSLIDATVNVVEIKLRATDGSPLPDGQINDAFAAAAAGATSRPIIYLTHGTKTGLIAPTAPPPGVDVIVDACQTRIAPQTVAAYLRQGWPVVVTGSKFFGGPAFSGAVLFPRARLTTIPPGKPPQLGTVLRWTAALAVIDAFEQAAAGMAKLLSNRTATIDQSLAANPALVPVGGMQPRGAGWADVPSIFTFGIRDPLDAGRVLPVSALRPLYERLARAGILLGQPVNLGAFGGLRLAIGARDLLDQSADIRLAQIFTALRTVTARL